MAGYIYTLKCLGKLKREETFLKNDFYIKKFHKEILHKKRFYKDYLKLNNLQDNEESIKIWSSLNEKEILDFYLSLLLNLKDTKAYNEWAVKNNYSIKNLNNINSLNEMKWNYDYSINVFKENYNVIEFGVIQNKIVELYQNWDADTVQSDTVSENRKTRHSVEVENAYEKFISLVRYGVVSKSYEYTNTKYLLDLEELKLEEIYIKFNDYSYLKFAKIDKNPKIIYNSKIIDFDRNLFEKNVVTRFSLKKVLNFVENNIEISEEDTISLKKIQYLLNN